MKGGGATGDVDVSGKKVVENQEAETAAQVDGRWQRCRQMGGVNLTIGNTTTSPRKIGGQREGCWRMP